MDWDFALEKREVIGESKNSIVYIKVCANEEKPFEGGGGAAIGGDGGI